MSNYILNPQTNRFVLRNGPLGKRLIRSGAVALPAVEQTSPIEIEIPEIPEIPEIQESKPLNIKEKLAEVGTDLIKDNKKLFKNSKDMSDSQLDALLERLLYDKLCIASKKPAKTLKKLKQAKWEKIVLLNH